MDARIFKRGIAGTNEHLCLFREVGDEEQW